MLEKLEKTVYIQYVWTLSGTVCTNFIIIFNMSTQPLTEMSTRDLPGGKGRPACKAHSLTAICESIVWKVWEPRRLTTLWASTAGYRDSFYWISPNFLLKFKFYKDCSDRRMTRQGACSETQLSLQQKPHMAAQLLSEWRALLLTRQSARTAVVHVVTLLTRNN
jgi:hypothetical protein